MVSRNTPSMIVCSVLPILLCCISAWSVVDAHSTSSYDYERYLPEGYYYYGYKKSKKGYYGSKGSKSSYYTKSDKKKKDCKSAKKKGNYYGYYDHCFEDQILTLPPIDGNFSDIDDILIDDVVTEVPKYYNSKGSKSGYYSKSDKKDDKKFKSLKDKSFKKDKKKKSEKGKFFSPPTPSPVDPGQPKSPDLGFAPDESWNLTFDDAADTGFLFYDAITKYAWYAYNTKVGDVNLGATIGRICPMDTANDGNVLKDLCIEIKAPQDWAMVTSTTIQSVGACYGSVTGAIFKLAVVVKDTSKVLHLADSLVGSRMLVYDVVVRGNSVVSDPIIVEVAYKDWKSLYGEPTINGRPSFTPDCKRVYATWLEPDNAAAGGYKSVTIATDVESATSDGNSAELWRLGTSTRLPGLTPSKDGSTLFSATNVAEGDDLTASGILALNSKNGQIIQEYVFPTNAAGRPNNAYTNLLIADSNSYHIDSLLGLVKFDLDDLNDGPIWSAVEGSTKITAETMSDMDGSRNLAPLLAPRNADSKMLTQEEDMLFTAFQPALDGSNSNTVYGCGNTASGNDIDGVVALGSTNGASVWFAEFDDLHVLNVGSCSGITHDILWGASAASSSGSAVYVGRGKVIQALDSNDGSLLWTHDTQGHGSAAQFVVISEEFVLVANNGTIIALDTVEPIEPTASPASRATDPSAPTDTVPTVQPTNSPTRAPLATPSPVKPAPLSTPEPTKSSGVSKTFGLSFGTTVLLALPLLVLLR